MKGKEEVSERMLTEKEASQLSDTEFKAMVIRKLMTKTKRQREDLKGSKGEKGSNIQGSPNTISN